MALASGGGESRLSAKGKKASEATDPIARLAVADRGLAASAAFHAAMRENHAGDIWPAPTPTVAPSFT